MGLFKILKEYTDRNKITFALTRMNKLSLISRTYFRSSEDILIFLNEIIIAILIIYTLTQNPHNPMEISIGTLGLGVIKSTVLLAVISPIMSMLYFLYFGILLLLFSITIRVFCYMVFVLTSPYYSEALFPEE